MVLIIKTVACVLWFFACCIITTVVSLFRPRHPSNSFIFTHLFTTGTTLILGIEIEIKNEERLMQTQPCIYISNHQSNLDVITHGAVYRPNTVVIGKKEIMYIPLFNLAFFLTGNIFLNRKNKMDAIASLREVASYIKKKRVSVFIFPEGTRNHGAKELLPFKLGAFHLAIDAQVPLLPIVASPVYSLIDLKSWTIKKGKITFEVMEPIPTTGKSQNDVETLAEQTRLIMQEKFNQLKSVVS